MSEFEREEEYLQKPSGAPDEQLDSEFEPELAPLLGQNPRPGEAPITDPRPGEAHPTDPRPGEDPKREAKGDPVKRTWNRFAAEGYNMIHNNNNRRREALLLDEEQEVHLLDAESESSSTKRSASETPLVAVIITCVLIILGLCGALVAVSLMHQSQATVCEAPDCTILAGTMLSKMDLTADPCDNFYKYSCSAAVHNPLVPPDKLKWGIFDEVAKKNRAVLQRLLDSPGDSYMGVPSTAIHKAKSVYQACMNVSQRENIGTEPLLKVIEDVGSWPILPAGTTGASWTVSGWDLDQSMAKAVPYGVSPLFSIGVTADDKNSSIQRIMFDQVSLTFSDYRYYLGNDTEKYKDAYVTYYVAIASLLGAENEAATAAANECWDMESALAQALDPPEQRTDPETLYNLMTVQQLSDTIGSEFDLTSYLSAVFNTDIDNSEELLVYAPNYFKKLGVLLTGVGETTLPNLLAWQVVMTMVPEMPLAFRLALQELAMALYGVQGSSAMWETCVGVADGVTGFATGALLVEHQFGSDDRERVRDILSMIRKTFSRDIPKLTWMDEQTKARALEKAEAVVQKIGFPDFILDVVKLDQYYSDLEVTGADSFHNDLNSRRFHIDRELSRRGKAPDPKDWAMTPAAVNAYYSPVGNEIVFPAGILQNPFYDKTFLRSLLFGAVGVVMGHELTHAFDNQGRMYDKDGNLNNWWTNESSQAFVEQTGCLVEEYSAFSVNGDPLNGLTTLGENIADNGGVKTAFFAYQEWLQQQVAPEVVLPGLNMTDNQLFFLSFAQVWCSYYTPEYAQQSLVTDAHSYAKYRVIGVLKNMPEFSEAFQCPIGSYMNPAKKCHVW